MQFRHESLKYGNVVPNFVFEIQPIFFPSLLCWDSKKLGALLRTSHKCTFNMVFANLVNILFIDTLAEAFGPVSNVICPACEYTRPKP